MSNSELLAWPFFGYAPGHYSLTCVRCKETHLDWCAGKRAISCLECAVIAAKEHIAELEADRTQLDELRAEMLALLIRYRNETPLGHQPHMIAHEADRVIEQVKALGGTNAPE